MSDSIKIIRKGSVARRILASMMDAVMTFFIFFALTSFVFTPIANKCFAYEDKLAKELSYQVGSKMVLYYEIDNDGNKIYYEVKDLANKSANAAQIYLSNVPDQPDEFYINKVKYYYLNYKTGVDVEIPEGGEALNFTAPNYNVEIDGQLPKDIYTETWFNSFIEGKTTTELIDAAMEDLYYSDFYQSVDKANKRIQLFIIIPSFSLSFLIFFLVIPLCFKTGTTLGKKVFNIGLVTKDGYQIQKRQIVFRQLTLFLYVSLFAVILGIGITSIATLCLGVLVYFIATLINKNKRSFVDLLAYTMTIDTVNSVWFKDELEEQAKENELQENLDKLNKSDIENKNVIQVGSTIVNEEIKKEIEEQKNNEK